MMMAGILALLVQVASPAAACGTGTEVWPTKKWQVTAPAALGLNVDSVKALVARTRAMPGVTSILVVRHGQIAVEEYFRGGSRGDPAPVASITKSVTSYLVGIALERGLIESLDQPLIQLVPQVAPPEGRPARKITIRQLLTMTSGLSDTWFQDKPLMLRLMSQPGTTFHYSNEGVQFLIRAIAQSSKESVLKFSRAALWKPLDIDIDESRWPRFELDGSGDGAAGLRLTARELGKLGLLALRSGCWEGQQLVPAAYLRQAMTKQVNAGGPDPTASGYGFLWWIAPDGTPYMAGQGGQYVVVHAGLDMVAVITGRGDTPDIDYHGLFRLVTEGVTGTATAP